MYQNGVGVKCFGCDRNTTRWVGGRYDREEVVNGSGRGIGRWERCCDGGARN
jgi:hypothetical protein